MCATIARGGISRADGGAIAASAGKAGRAKSLGVATLPPTSSPPPGQGSDARDAAANELANCEAMQELQQAGVVLDDPAFTALLQLPVAHAVELLHIARGKAATLRNPSRYVTATVGRGFRSRAVAAFDVTPPPRPPHGSPAPVGVGPSGAGEAGHGPGLVPDDATLLERWVLAINDEGPWPGQQITVATLLSL